MKKILFITDIGLPWGGSEELWSKSATILKNEGFNIQASVGWYGQVHPKMQNMIDIGIKVHFRKNKVRNLLHKAYGVTQNGLLKYVKAEAIKHIDKIKPDFIVFSQSHIFSAWEYMRYAKKNDIRYCVITQLNSELSWANDTNYKQIRQAFVGAESCFFVSKGNLELLETQLAFKLSNAEVISNPFNMDSVKDIQWPKMDTLNFAYVGRLDFTHKGIDILLKSFATESWKKREFLLNIYGSGNIELTKELVNHLDLSEKVIFHGHVNNIHEIWKKNHILALASRYEGMPLVLIEAMFCKRTAIVTDVAGHGELISDGVNGFVVAAAQNKLFAQKLEVVWANKHRLEDYGKAALSTIKKSIEELPEKKFSELIKNTW
ncbi:glycosyltransferase involved in cell wall biosynthesis [Gelidibacter algens]|uniref:Glycosyltransferase involved in cell wall biosynthesis n=1 Tax=Gelidibacter algens TaxID=49280 RepID=A0A1A7R1Z5_9FLAO|nr:glycosyltransferase [Gelidibacter algens]OBX25528.1 hypothetical protein A9996_09480 [Gelidibacter algens]RAJ22256.1 glycosyltransferase involved in cell wall biosynthesis [Gelidibacter algens]